VACTGTCTFVWVPSPGYYTPVGDDCSTGCGCPPAPGGYLDEDVIYLMCVETGDPSPTPEPSPSPTPEPSPSPTPEPSPSPSPSPSPEPTTTEEPGSTIGQCTYRCIDHHWKLRYSDCIDGYICPVNPDFPEPDGSCTNYNVYITFCVRETAPSPPSPCPNEDCYWSCIDGHWELVDPSVAESGNSKCFENSSGNCECEHPIKYLGEPCSHGAQVLKNCRPRAVNECAWQCMELAPGIFQWVQVKECSGGVCPRALAGWCNAAVEGRIITYPCEADEYAYCYSRCDKMWDSGVQSYVYFWAYMGLRCTYLEHIIPCDESTDNGTPIEITSRIMWDCCNNLVDRECVWLCVDSGSGTYSWLLINGPANSLCYCEDPIYSCNACHVLETTRTACGHAYELASSEFNNNRCIYDCITRIDTGESYVLSYESNCRFGYSCDPHWSTIIACKGLEPGRYWAYHDLAYEEGTIANIQTYRSSVPCSKTGSAEEIPSTCVWFCNGSEWELIQDCLNPYSICPEPECKCNASLTDVYEVVDCEVDAASTTAPPCYGRTCRWRCTGLLTWEKIVDCDSPCFCEPPNVNCTYANICSEVETQCGYTTPASTTSSTTLAPTTTAVPACSTYICRWYCRYDLTSNSFEWYNVQPCPSGCSCTVPTVECGPSTACTYLTYICTNTTSTTPAPSDCGNCTYVCVSDTYYLISNSCTGNCYCVEGLPCSNDGEIATIPCYKPSTTTTSTSTSSTTTTIEYSEGYCVYICLSGNTLYRIEDNCVSPNVCDEFLAFTCNPGEYYFLPCSSSGGYPIVLSAALDIELDFNTLEVSIAPTTPEPDYIEPNPLAILYELISPQLYIQPTTTLPKCFGECRFICVDDRWYLINSTCSCVCQEPTEACVDGTEAAGTCVDIEEITPTLPPIGTTSWGTTPGYPTTTSSTTPAGYPNGYCKYRCTFYTYILEEDTCASGYYCEYFYEADCDPESIIYSACLEE